jgi:hypothetical protein
MNFDKYNRLVNLISSMPCDSDIQVRRRQALRSRVESVYFAEMSEAFASQSRELSQDLPDELPAVVTEEYLTLFFPKPKDTK